MPSNRPFSIGSFLVHFFFGALLGALATAYLWLSLDAEDAWLGISACAFTVGLIAGSLGDRFWESFREWWNPFRWR